MIHVGIDPDVCDMAVGFWADGLPVGAQVIHVIRRKGVVGGASVMQMVDALRRTQPQEHGVVESVAIEGQQIDRREARPADLFTLAQATGAVAYWLRDYHPDALFRIAPPKEWKGQVAKHAHQARLYSDLGWGYTIIGSGKGKYARPLRIPSNFHHITPGQWKHCGDALLLARWASEQ